MVFVTCELEDLPGGSARISAMFSFSSYENGYCHVAKLSRSIISMQGGIANVDNALIAQFHKGDKQTMVSSQFTC